MKLTKCKRCDADNVYWTQNAIGKWTLLNSDNVQHHCDDGKLKAVKCKYCSADDLHWGEELVQGGGGVKRAVLTESYGLPHACDERIAFLAKEKQDKKDKYEAEKKRINAIPDNKPCESCNASGYNFNSQLISNRCVHCFGYGRFSPTTKKDMLAHVRRQIWPNMHESNGNRGYSFKRRY